MVGSYPGQLSSRKRGLHSLGIVTLICYLAETGTRIGEITLVHYFAQGETHSEGRYPGPSLIFHFPFCLQVRKLEAYMLAFRDYANLVVMELTPLIEYYCIDKKTAADGKH